MMPLELLRHGDVMSYSMDMQDTYSEVVDYIEAYWSKAMVHPGSSQIKSARNLVFHLGNVRLPHAFISPNHGYFSGTQFYWDTYFTIVGLVVSGNNVLAKGMVDNICYLFNKFALVPARNSWTSLGRSQPPCLTRMAFEIFEHGTADKAWMTKVMDYAQQEYNQVWMTGRRADANSGLSRYNPKYFSKSLTVMESGWDLSSRFSNRAKILPVDLNCLLYQYESDFLGWATICDDKQAMKRWQEALQHRKKLITEYFWDETSGFFYDYNLTDNKQASTKDLSRVLPIMVWHGNIRAGRKMS